MNGPATQRAQKNTEYLRSNKHSPSSAILFPRALQSVRGRLGRVLMHLGESWGGGGRGDEESYKKIESKIGQFFTDVFLADPMLSRPTQSELT